MYIIYSVLQYGFDLDEIFHTVIHTGQFKTLRRKTFTYEISHKLSWLAPSLFSFIAPLSIHFRYLHFYLSSVNLNEAFLGVPTIFSNKETFNGYLLIFLDKALISSIFDLKNCCHCSELRQLMGFDMTKFLTFLTHS
jgi:hypothetical protein